MYPLRMQNMQSVDERYYALLQGVQCMVLWVMVSQVVSQTPKRISEQLHFLCLLTKQKHNQNYHLAVEFLHKTVQ